MNMQRIWRSPWVRRGLMSAGLLVVIALFVEPRDIMGQVQRLSLGWVVVALLISVVQIMLSAWRWQLTANRVGAPLRFSYALREYYLALLVNQILPGGILGDAGRAHRHAQQAGSRGSAWRAVIIERTSGQVAVVGLTIAALLLSPLWHAVLGWPVSLTIVGGLCFAGVAVWQGVVRLPSSRLPAWCHSMGVDIKRGLFSPGVWHLQLASSLVIVMSYGVVMVCAARAIGVELAASKILALAPVLLLAMLIPLSVAGWGLREGAAVATWALVGLPTAQGVAVSLAYGVLVLLSSLPGIWVALDKRHRAQPSGKGGGSQYHIKQRVVSTAKRSHRRAQSTSKRLDRRHLKPRPARADQQWGDQKVQAINDVCFNKPGNRYAAPFHQNALQTTLIKQRDYIIWGELPLRIQRQYMALNPRIGRRRCIRPHDVQRGRRVGVEQLYACGHTTARIKHYPRGMRAGDMTHCQLGVVSTGRTGADDNGIHQRPQPMQVNQALMAVDVVRVAALRRNTPVQALPQLGNHPVGAACQRHQAVQQVSGRRCYSVLTVPVALSVEPQWRLGCSAFTYCQQPRPRRVYIQRRLLLQQCFRTNAATMVTGVGHNASTLRKQSYLAGPYSSTQAYATRCTRQSGGHYVSH